MSKLSIGIVGLPNVGKSTLFQALTSAAVPAENYPFCTIDPNVGVVEVHDPRLWRLAELVAPRRVTPAVVEFVDIAGLVEGAARGEGLGNRFLQHIREVHAIAHVLRCFQDPSVMRVGHETDPFHDRDIVEIELALADLETVTRSREKAEKKGRGGDKEAAQLAGILGRLEARLSAGEPARREQLNEEERRAIRSLNLLTMKPMLYVANADESSLSDDDAVIAELRAGLTARDPGALLVPVCARLEAELSELEESERTEYLEALGLHGSGLEKLTQAAYRLLGLHTFFTAGEKEVRAWTVRLGARAPEAAGVIHSDFERGFIRAETIPFTEFVEFGSFKAAREAGRIRLEGKDYVVEDGDVMLFRTSA